MTTLMTIPKTQYPSMDDARLAQQARTDPQAFAELYRRHVRSIYRYHLAHTGNVKDAEDLTSQTFMAALEGIRSFRGTGPYITWLIGIASRKRLLFFRRGRSPRSRWIRCFTSPPQPSHRQSRGAAPPNGSAICGAADHQPGPRRSDHPVFFQRAQHGGSRAGARQKRSSHPNAHFARAARPAHANLVCTGSGL